MSTPATAFELRPLPDTRQGMERPDRFWTRVDMTPGHGPKGECWLWTGSVSKGYGNVGMGREGGKKKVLGAHVVAFFLSRDRMPAAGLLVCHHCDFPLCVRPDHLFEGTDADNAKDRNSKGRSARGETSGVTKFTDADVIAIRSAGIARLMSATRLAALYGVSRQTITDIINRKRWKHLP